MGLQLTTEQVITLAPDSSSASAGKKLNNKKYWKNTGQSTQAMWGECQGSALYQIRIDLSSMTIQCSCPSRKLPCKHGLGLLLLAVNNSADVPETEEPDWIVAWLERRRTTAQRKETPKEAKQTGEPSAAQKKAAEKRLVQVTRGIEQLDLWLNDQIRQGLASLETKSAIHWEKQAAQMIDAQAPGLASRLRRMAGVPHATPDWTTRLLMQMGELTLLTQAFHRLDQLEPGLREEVRQLIGWNFKEDEVVARGEAVVDDWLLLGQVREEAERGQIQRVWLVGSQSKRHALLLQYAPPGGAFAHYYPLGSQLQGKLVYWPGAAPQRALLHKKLSEAQPIVQHLPGHSTIDDFFTEIVQSRAQQPWRERFLCILNDVVPVLSDQRWFICDSQQQALPLSKQEHWQLLACSGGHPVDLVGEWDGDVVKPFGILAEGHYYLLESMHG